jgi:hypothetical protein
MGGPSFLKEAVFEILLKKGQTLEKVSLFLVHIFLVNGMNNPNSNLT